MFLDTQFVTIICPGCKKVKKVRLLFILRERVVTCIYCKQRIKLRSGKKSRASFNALEKSLDNLKSFFKN